MSVKGAISEYPLCDALWMGVFHWCSKNWIKMYHYFQIIKIKHVFIFLKKGLKDSSHMHEWKIEKLLILNLAVCVCTYYVLTIFIFWFSEILFSNININNVLLFFSKVFLVFFAIPTSEKYYYYILDIMKYLAIMYIIIYN